MAYGFWTRGNSPAMTPKPTIPLPVGNGQIWLLSTVFYMTFPASLAICYLPLAGPQKTKQPLWALVNRDFLLQTIFVFCGFGADCLGHLAFSGAYIYGDFVGLTGG